MPSNTSALLKIELPVTGEQKDDWGDNQNQIAQRIEESISDITNIAVTGAADYTLDDTEFVVHDDATPTAEVHPAMIKATGTLTNTQDVIVPTRNGFWWVWNATSGAHDFTVKTSAGTGVVVPSGTIMKLFCDGTNVEAASPAVDTDGNLTITALNGTTITGSTINSTSIGASAPSTGVFTSVTTDTADINGGTLDGVTIGASVPAAGTFTTLNTSGSATVGGDLIVNGTTITVEATTVEVADNTMLLNKNEVGAGVTAGTAGIEIERGSETNYQFVFRESDDSFVVGETGSLQSVATREESPTDNGLAFWDSATSKFETSANVVYDGTDLFTGVNNILQTDTADKGYLITTSASVHTASFVGDGTVGKVTTNTNFEVYVDDTGGAGPGNGTLALTVNGEGVIAEGYLQAKGGSPVVNMTSLAYEPVITDGGKTILMENSSSVASMVFTLPSSASVAFVIGTYINVLHKGPGALTFAAAGGVTLSEKDGNTTSGAQWSLHSFFKYASDAWVLTGNTA